MICFCLQDYTTVRGNAVVTAITQPASGWLDLSAFQDIVAFLDAREVTPLGTGGTAVSVAFQTSPTQDEGLFASLTSSAVSVSAPGVTVTQMLKDTTTVPLSRWLRWQLAPVGGSTGSWDITFRIWIAASRIGPARISPETAARMPPPTPSVPLAPPPTSSPASYYGGSGATTSPGLYGSPSGGSSSGGKTVAPYGPG